VLELDSAEVPIGLDREENCLGNIALEEQMQKEGTQNEGRDVVENDLRFLLVVEIGEEKIDVACFPTFLLAGGLVFVVSLVAFSQAWQNDLSHLAHRNFLHQ